MVDASADALIDVSGHLSFLRQVVDRHVHSASARTQVLDRLSALDARAHDPKLYLAVIGEFSAGKSTLINGILRTPLLKSSVEATTAAITRIQYGPVFRLIVTWANGAVVDGDEAHPEGL